MNDLKNTARKGCKMQKKRIRNKKLHVMVSAKECRQIKERMVELGTINMSAFIRRMAICGYAFCVDTESLKELISLQRRCVNNFQQIVNHTDSDEMRNLQEKYSALWGDYSKVLVAVAELMEK